MIQVIAADDHPLLQEGIKKVLGKEVDIELCNVVASGNEVLEALAENKADVLVLDMDMPGRSGLDLLKDISQRYPQIPILILTIHPAERFAVRALKAGAVGYLSKSNISDELAKAIRTVSQRNKRYITSEVAEQLAMQVENGNGASHESLSDREFEVFCLLAAGKSVGEIAGKLSLSSNTVHTYRSRVKEKMNMDSNVEMSRYAMENDLIS